MRLLILAVLFNSSFRLTKLAVAGYESIETLMEEGNKVSHLCTKFCMSFPFTWPVQKRHTASHALNAESSRSHAVFTLFFTQARYDSATDSTGEKVYSLMMPILIDDLYHTR